MQRLPCSYCGNLLANTSNLRRHMLRCPHKPAPVLDWFTTLVIQTIVDLICSLLTFTFIPRSNDAAWKWVLRIALIPYLVKMVLVPLAYLFGCTTGFVLRVLNCNGLLSSALDYILREETLEVAKRLDYM